MNITAKAWVMTLLPLMIWHACSCKNEVFRPEVVYRSDDLVITRISERSFEHTSFLQTEDFGHVPCNGLVVSDSHEAIVFDCPANDRASEILIKWITDTLHCQIKAVIPTHFHRDCLGGLGVFHERGIPSYAYDKTIALAKEHGYPVPGNGFRDSLVLRAGRGPVLVKFFGEGHTKDNVVGYFPGENILFGGCLVKELDADKGYLGDAHVEAWSGTVEAVKNAFPDVQVVIPGHGNYGDRSLLDYTIGLFKAK